MRKSFFVFFLLALTISLTGAGCKAKQQSSSEQDSASKTTKEESYSGSVKDLVKLGKSVKCVIAKGDSNIVSGTMYVSGEKAKGDYQLTVPTLGTMTSHFISDGTWMYSWSDKFPEQNIKIKIDQTQNDKTKADVNEADSYDSKMDYKCSAWRADVSYFIPPKDIKFNDYTSLINNAKNAAGSGISAETAEGNPALCKTCDSITDAKTKAACKQSLGCK